MTMQDGTSGKKHVVEDFSQPINPTTRSSVAATNPIVGGSIMDPERLAASRAAAEKHVANIQQQFEQPAQPSEEPAPQVPQADQPNPVPTLQSDLSLLATTGRIEEEVIVGGYKFKLRTLTVRENNEVLVSTGGGVIQNLAQLGHLRVAVLSRAIDTVNGVPLESLYKGTDEWDNLEKRLAVVDSWQLPMITRLFDAYNNMLQRSEEAFGGAFEGGELKN